MNPGRMSRFLSGRFTGALRKKCILAGIYGVVFC